MRGLNSRENVFFNILAYALTGFKFFTVQVFHLVSNGESGKISSDQLAPSTTHLLAGFFPVRPIFL